MLREQAALARAEGYQGLRIVADMDWLLGAHPSLDTVVGFELFLDRHVAELGAAVICAYRRSSFDTFEGALCVHPLRAGSQDTPVFTLVSGQQGSWHLSGEIDIAAIPVFAASFGAIARQPCVLDVSHLDFIDLVGMRTIAGIAIWAKTSVILRGIRPALKCYWSLAGFDELSPGVQLAA